MLFRYSKYDLLPALLSIMFLLCLMSNGVCLVGHTFYSRAFCDAYARELDCDENTLRMCLEGFLRGLGLRLFFILGLPIQIVVTVGFFFSIASTVRKDKTQSVISPAKAEGEV